MHEIELQEFNGCEVCEKTMQSDAMTAWFYF